MCLLVCAFVCTCVCACVQAWIMNSSLRENVLFGHEFEQHRYDAIVEACALKQVRRGGGKEG